MPGKKRRYFFYAISNGRCPPCIATTWAFTNPQVDGFSQNRYKGFDAFHDAKDWLLAELSHRQDGCPQTFYFVVWPSDGDKSLKQGDSGPSEFYAVTVGRKIGVYSDYSDVQAQVKGHSGATHKGHATFESACASLEVSKAWRDQWRVTTEVVQDDEEVIGDLDGVAAVETMMGEISL